ncbi:MAG: diguanylate cyclase [Ramlibacter sp.]|nr:diguanylate cyclase [Ramlibacter sp.]
MQATAIGFWGAYFGTVALLLAGSIAAFARSLHRVAISAALFALISAFYFAAYLDWVPLDGRVDRLRWLSQISVVSAAVLGSMVLAMLGVMRHPRRRRRIRVSIAVATACVIALEWVLTPEQALDLGTVVTLAMAFAMLYVCIRSAARGDRLAWWAVTGVSFMIFAIAGLSMIARDPAAVQLWVHAVSAVSGMAFVSVMATALWIRYSYLIELREVVAHGPSYDPITRMRSHLETGQMVGLAFFGARGESRPVGVIAVAIGNFYSLEQLHGRAAVNHALFVCASRLRRCVPGQVEMGRLGEDGFLLIVRRFRHEAALVELASIVAERLARPVTLSTSAAPADLEAGRAYWKAQVGVGLFVAQPGQRPSEAISTARDMARTAWTYGSRVAVQEPVTSFVVEAPAQAVA